MLALKLLFPLALLAATYQPAALNNVRALARSAHGCGETPVVVLDLDDTLIHTRARTLRILREFAEATAARFPREAAHVARMNESEVRYLLKDTFAGLGISNSQYLAEAEAFWKPRFFSCEYVRGDRALPGAAAYVRALESDGATIVYLTGRDRPSMGLGTEANLRELGFPEGKLLMKPDAKMDDLEFKRQALSEIRSLGPVVGVFENEPANLNLLHEAFPAAQGVFVDSIHSPKPVVPYEGAAWVRDFLAEPHLL